MHSANIFLGLYNIGPSKDLGDSFIVSSVFVNSYSLHKNNLSALPVSISFSFVQNDRTITIDDSVSQLVLL
jgi:hypothetical protein